MYESSEISIGLLMYVFYCSLSYGWGRGNLANLDDMIYIIMNTI